MSLGLIRFWNGKFSLCDVYPSTNITPRLKRKISYDARKSILTIFPMSGQRHGYILDWLHKVAVSASLTLDPWICRRVFFINNTKFYQFEGEWDGSLKFPDFTVAWRNDVDGPDLHTVVEVGCSQSRDSLLEVRDAYLRGMPSLSRFICINIIETPEYVSPKNIDIDELREVKIKAIQSDSDKGSAWYKGIQWVGETTISWEVWERDPTSGEPVQVFEATVDPNDSEGRLPFFEIPRIMALGVEAVTVKPADIHDFWQMAIKEEAKLRIWEYVADVEKRRKSAADIAEQKDEATKTRQKRNEERTERWERRSER